METAEVYRYSWKGLFGWNFASEYFKAVQPAISKNGFPRVRACDNANRGYGY